MTAPAQPVAPGLVFAPARPRAEGGRRDVVFEMREQPDGALVLPVYSSLARLVEALGNCQPWACVPLARVRAVLGDGRVARVLVDPELEQQAWRWTGAALAEFGGHQSGEYQGRHAGRVPARSSGVTQG